MGNTASTIFALIFAYGGYVVALLCRVWAFGWLVGGFHNGKWSYLVMAALWWTTADVLMKKMD